MIQLERMQLSCSLVIVDRGHGALSFPVTDWLQDTVLYPEIKDNWQVMCEWLSHQRRLAAAHDLRRLRPVQGVKSLHLDGVVAARASKGL